MHYESCGSSANAQDVATLVSTLFVTYLPLMLLSCQRFLHRHHDFLVSFDCDIDRNTRGTVRLIVMGGTVDMSVVQLKFVWCS